MTAHGRRACVLVVDDDPSVLATVGRIFDRDYHVELAGSGAKALADARSDSPRCGHRRYSNARNERAAVNEAAAYSRTRPRRDRHDGNGRGTRRQSRASDRWRCLLLCAEAVRSPRTAYSRNPLSGTSPLARGKEQYVRALQADLNKARSFQMSLLPPPHAEFRTGLSIDARSWLATNWQATFFDYALVDSTCVAIVIADVVGHGTSAAMLTSIVKSAFHAALVHSYDPLRVIHGVKEGVRAFRSRVASSPYAPLALISPRESLVYCNAGHPPVLLHRVGAKPVFLDTSGPMISSIFIDSPCGSEHVSLENGDVLLFYTDGVTEAHGPTGDNLETNADSHR